MINDVADFVKSCDLKITNLETNLSDFEYFPGPYGGGRGLNTRRSCLTSDLQKFGFNCFGTANNHCMDYSYNGLISTIETLEKAGFAHCGTGRSLAEAAAPAIIDCDGAKCAVFAVDASLEDASRPACATKLKARPGVNYLRHNDYYKVTEEEVAQLRSIAKNCRINFVRENSIATGYLTPDPEGFFVFGGKKFTTKEDMPGSECHAGDKERLLNSFREAKKSCDYVFVMVHCHDCDGHRVENPPAYLVEFAHACIDAGVSAVFGGGCHRLRPIEIYNNAPIFYSLGDFIYQGLRIEHLPADFMEQYSIDVNSTAEEALWARSQGNKVGLHCNKLNYQTVLPKLQFEDGKMTGFKLLPLYLNFHRQDKMNGLPEVARGAEGEEIRDLLNSLSEPYGVKLKFDGDGTLILA
jgi:poly-gamma-glutamate synthesis protein (capsule biosynthesis protein)